MGGISYTAHVSNKKSAITSKAKLQKVAKHNLRKYKSADYNADNIFLIYGTTNLVQNVKDVYHKEFDLLLMVYNDSQKRADRKIYDYFEHVASKEQDMAVEIIFQIGDREFWKQNDNGKVYMTQIYKLMLSELQRKLPDFKVANAVIHMDEDSPHMHVVGVPVAEGFKKSLYRQVSKRSVFTPKTLSKILQDDLREFANQRVESFLGDWIKEKSKGRNHDLSVMEYKVAKEEMRYDELKEQADEKLQEKEQLEQDVQQLSNDCDYLSKQVAYCQEGYEEATKKVREANERAERMEAHIQTQCDTMADLEEQATELQRKASIAEQVYDMAIGSGGNESLREKLVDVMYENEQLKEENSKLKQLLEKAYNFMKQYLIGEKNLFELFQEKIGMVLEKVRDGFRR